MRQTSQHLLSPSWLVVIETCVCRASECISSKMMLTLSYSNIAGEVEQFSSIKEIFSEGLLCDTLQGVPR